MATIYRRGTYWWISYQIHGKRVSKSLKVTKKSDAQKHKALVEARLIEQPQSLDEKDVLTESFWDSYSDWAKDHKRPSTIRSETVSWKKFIEFCQPRRLGDVTPNHVENFKVHLLECGLKKISVNHALKNLQSLYNYAAKLHMYSGVNPFQSIERYKIPKNPPKFLDDEQLDALLESAQAHSPTMHMYVALGAFAGFRKSEIVFSVWEWFDFRTKRITLQSGEEFELKDSEHRTIPLFTRL